MYIILLKIVLSRRYIPAKAVLLFLETTLEFFYRNYFRFDDYNLLHVVHDSLKLCPSRWLLIFEKKGCMDSCPKVVDAVEPQRYVRRSKFWFTESAKQGTARYVAVPFP